MLCQKFSHQFGKCTAKSSMHIFIKILECQNAKETKRKNTVFISFGSYFKPKYSNYGMMTEKIVLSFDFFLFWDVLML